MEDFCHSLDPSLPWGTVAFGTFPADFAGPFESGREVASVVFSLAY